jgi:hypothetical protein
MADASKNKTDGYTTLVANNGEREDVVAISKAYRRMPGDFGDIFWKSEELEQPRSAEGSMKVNSSEKGTREEFQKGTGSKQYDSKGSASSEKK